MAIIKPWEMMNPGFFNHKYYIPKFGYQIKDNQLIQIISKYGAMIDPHIHTKYSNEVLQTPVTKFLKVKESYTSPKKLVKILKKRGKNIFTIQDHNSIKAMSELRKECEKNNCKDRNFMCCEYDVRISPDDLKRTIHIGVWGLDYAESKQNQLSEEKVKKIHKHLIQTRNKGYEKFLNECKSLDLIAVFNHPGWILNPKNPMSGKQLYKISSDFDYLEINGDVQLENLITLELALEMNKTLVAGSDAHTLLRAGKTYVLTDEPVDNAYEFLNAVKSKKISINSQSSLPVAKQFDEKELIEAKFNGTAIKRINDSYEGIKNYFLYEWNNVKLLLLGITGTTAPLSLFINGGAFSMIPFAYSWTEKIEAGKKSKDLYCDLQDYACQKNLKQTDDEKEKEKIRLFYEQRKENFTKIKLIKPPTGWSKIVYDTLGKLPTFHPNYDYRVVDITE